MYRAIDAEIEQCDEQRPFCGNCRRLNKHCRGYSSDLVWICERTSGGPSKGRDRDENAALRYPLFTENERDEMCRELTASTGGATAGKLLDQLDAQYEEGGAAGDGLSRGPFHVFAVRYRRWKVQSVKLMTAAIDTRCRLCRSRRHTNDPVYN